LQCTTAAVGAAPAPLATVDCRETSRAQLPSPPVAIALEFEQSQIKAGLQID